MSRFSQLTWYRISEAIPKVGEVVLIRIQEDKENIYRAVRINFEAARYGFLFVLLNDFKVEEVSEDHINENTAFCPASVIEWCYLTA